MGRFKQVFNKIKKAVNMDFYRDWENNIHNIELNKKYTKMFLFKNVNSLKIFKYGTTEELTYVCKFLLKIPISNFVYCIDEDRKCTADMIIQYSNLEHGLINIPRILKYSDEPMTFAQIGRIIIKAKEEGACKKYGENHSKVANELSMVNLERKNSIYVSNTAFGNFSAGLSNFDRIELSKRLFLRNEFIQKLIYLSKRGIVNYMDVAKEVLSESTAIRRKSNVRQVTNLILEDDPEIVNNIVW